MVKYHSTFLDITNLPTSCVTLSWLNNVILGVHSPWRMLFFCDFLIHILTDFLVNFTWNVSQRISNKMNDLTLNDDLWKGCFVALFETRNTIHWNKKPFSTASDISSPNTDQLLEDFTCLIHKPKLSLFTLRPYLRIVYISFSLAS